MSYRKPDTGNSMNDYFTSLKDFVKLSPKLLEAEDENVFIHWFDKLSLIDRRALLIFLRKNKDKIPANHLTLAQQKFNQTI